MYIKKETVSVTTAADGVDFTITTEASGQNLWVDTNINASEVVHPRAQVHDVDGSALTFDGTRKVCEPIAVANERVKIVIAAGGNAKSGTFHITVG